jgi:hypothetical protein
VIQKLAAGALAQLELRELSALELNPSNVDVLPSDSQLDLHMMNARISTESRSSYR